MTYEPEHTGAPSYEGEVIEEPIRLRPRTWVAVGALGTLGVGLLIENYWLVTSVIAVYVVWMFLRHWLRKRAFEKTWRRGGGTVDRMKGANLR